ncbi:hypothetical protein [Acidovorax sp.]|nr:hypothetical protein [Acidovorax sp.]
MVVNKDSRARSTTLQREAIDFRAADQVRFSRLAVTQRIQTLT